ncbi:MAG: hypothetical protein AAF193_06550, partial [Bacteroidota bacterium]
LNRDNLNLEYQKMMSQKATNQEIFNLRKSTYFQNQNLYREGLIGLDQLLNNYRSIVNAEIALIGSITDIYYTQTKIQINNRKQW